MSLRQRYASRTPKFFRKIIRISLICAAAAAALLMADQIGKSIISGFSFSLHPYVEIACKNIVAGGIVAAAVAKFTKEEDKPKSRKQSYKAPNDPTS